MTEGLPLLIAVSLLGGVAGIAGGLILVSNEKGAKILEKYAVSFSAGVLIAVSVFHLIPESLEIGGDEIPLVLLTSFFLAFISEQLVFKIHHHKHDNKLNSRTGLIIFGDTVHNALDGMAIALSFIASPVLGLAVSAATFIHEVPHEIADFALLKKAGWKSRSIVAVNIASGLITTLSAIVFYTVGTSIQFLEAPLLAVSAGVFLYLGASDLLPEVSAKRGSKLGWLPVLLGAAMMVLVFTLLSEH